MKTLFRNGSIHTMNGTEVVHSLLVEDGRILDVNCDVPAGECQVVDLHGKTVLPGFHDSHEHFLCYATDKEKINFFGIRSLEEMAERTRRYIADRGIKKGEWIQGGGWNENEFDVPVLPSRQDLDKFCPDNPAIFTRTCCSVAVANTAALKAAEVVGKGLAASPGSACGQIVFTAEEAEEMVKSGKMKKVVLVRLETSPEDIVGMQVSQGILTVRGGMTSHAAVVARGMGTCCVSGCGNDNDVKIDEEAKTFEINGHKFVEGDWISIDGSTGNIYGEQVATVAATGNKNFNRFMGWADAARQLLVMTNADNPRDAQQAVDLGAEGIGLCRTEHMFFAEDRIKAVREMICARTVEEREAALAKVEPFQQGDFEAMYRIMGERPMTIRYLDPPLHEFLPTKDEDIKELAADMGMTFDDLKNVVASLHEFNPMMGHRGCRLAVTYPEIAAMQTRAVIKAALNVSAETGFMITPHIMIPLVGEVKELKFVKDVVVKVADELIAAAGVDMKYQVGTMIEIPRAALTAGEIAKEAEFFSFGTNDLTQMTFGFSRDDAAKFLGAYYENKIYESDPFQHLDQIGVGKLVKMAAHDGRETRPDLGLGICGEHGGDPTSVEFCHNVGLDYVSCSPFRVPIARLAAAQAAIKNPRA